MAGFRRRAAVAGRGSVLTATAVVAQEPFALGKFAAHKDMRVRHFTRRFRDKIGATPIRADIAGLTPPPSRDYREE